MTNENLSSFEDLQEKYQVLLAENRQLKEELNALKAGLSPAELQQQDDLCFPLETQPKNILRQPSEPSPSIICSRSESAEKIRLFMSLFKGRDDVYARRWENKKKGTCGYSPACLNEWKQGLCGKPRVSCITGDNST